MMKFNSVKSLSLRKGADALILPFFAEKKHPLAAFSHGDALEKHWKNAVLSKDFEGKIGQSITLYPAGEKEKRLVLLGLGKKTELSVEKLRVAYSQLVKELLVKKIETLNIISPEEKSLTNNEIVLGISEGLLLPNYSFDRLKNETLKKKPTVLLKQVNWIGIGKKELQIAKERAIIADAVYFSRDLINGNADEITPQYFVKLAKEFEKNLSHVKAFSLDKKKLIKEKMGLLLAVNRGSNREPALVVLSYKGKPKSKDHTVIVGKGVTYDTGGLNLKPTGFMETMKCDMSGAAVAFATIMACSLLGVKRNVSAVIPTTENSIDSASYKPGDVYVSYSGKTVEIGNTDAEGRLILADALSYSVKNLHPTRIVDVATLTGAIVIALGDETTGLMSNDDKLSNSLIESGHRTYERLCRLPIYDEYKEQIKSDIADIKNVGGRAAGSITAALFLCEFVDKIPWAHLDIAGTAFYDKAKRYHPKYATGIGVRLLLDWLMSHP